jgi:hypothetical protein
MAACASVPMPYSLVVAWVAYLPYLVAVVWRLWLVYVHKFWKSLHTGASAT